MRRNPPYWYWPLDRWNLGVTAVLLVALIAALVVGGRSTPPLSAPTIAQPAPGAVLSAAAPGAMSGRTQPQAMVRVFDGATMLGETRADAAGFYHFSLPALKPGPHTFTTVVLSEKGETLSTSSPLSVMVDAAPVAQASPALAAKSGASVAVISGLAEGAEIPFDKPGTPLTGTGVAGSTVRLFANDKQIAQTIVGADGKWSLALPGLAPGAYTLGVALLR